MFYLLRKQWNGNISEDQVFVAYIKATWKW